ncbi:MAG TPA: DUF4870 domain-containing protein [Dehalococcoidia bacterium]|nr:DUF4870 domain-containing protein [Dehalococcoidia bacterium]
MGLSPEDKKRIYEEEKERIEAREKIEREKLTEPAGTSTGLSPNIAGLLCYVGVWISGIIFLVLEQRNKFVRFHAAQSIIVFGTLTVAGIILGLIPVVGVAFSTIIGITGFIVWIIMIVKASSGEWYKLPWAGDVAEKIVASSGVTGESSEPPPSEPAAESEAEAPTPPPAADSGKRIRDKVDAHFKSRSGRITASAFAIAWSLVLLIFFNFFNQYVAYYQSETVGGITTWTRYPFFTADVNLWLPILTATLIIAIVGHIILIILDRYILREMIHIVINAFSLWTVLTLLSVFPFDFSVIPNPTAADATHLGVSIFLIFISVGIGIAILVSVIKLIVNVVRGTASYEEHI